MSHLTLQPRGLFGVGRLHGLGQAVVEAAGRLLPAGLLVFGLWGGLAVSMLLTDASLVIVQ